MKTTIEELRELIASEYMDARARRRLSDFADRMEVQPSIDALREAGNLVLMWTPEELKNTDVDGLEDYLISKGNDYIEDS